MTSLLTKLDTKPLRAITETLRQKLKKVPAIMRSAVDISAADMRAEHTYQNRTGLLEQKSLGKTVRVTGAEIRVELGMYRPYAGYVYRRGLTTFDEGVGNAKQLIAAEFRRLGL